MQHFTLLRAASCIAAAFGLVGCAQINDAGMALFSSNMPAIVMVGGQLLQGEMQLFPDHTGTLSVRADSASSAEPGKPGLSSCVGRLRYSATTTGSVDLRCNAGVAVHVHVTLLGETRGYGYGSNGSDTAGLTFGMSAQESRAHLPVPPGRQLQDRADATYLDLK